MPLQTEFMATSCKVEECKNEKIKARGFCSRHYGRLIKHGSPLGGGTFFGKPGDFFESSLRMETDDCIIWPFSCVGLDRMPYPIWDGKRLNRTVCERVYGPPPSNAHQAAHSCNKSRCINKRHLRWDTPQGNNDDRIAAGTIPMGEGHVISKLTDENVRYIRSKQGSSTGVELGKIFGVDKSTIYKIWRRSSWRHI